VNFKLITDKKLAKYIFNQAHLTDDDNRNNYTVDQFDKAWAKWIGFYVLYDEVNVVAFCGIRKFNNQEARIFDRYFVTPHYRSNSLAHTEWASIMVNKLVDDCINNGYQPFFSIQTAKKRNSIQTAVSTLNKHIISEFRVLDGLYCTVPTSRDDPNCWQNIATISPYSISLEKQNE
jgi:hypothetical protein